GAWHKGAPVKTVDPLPENKGQAQAFILPENAQFRWERSGGKTNLYVTSSGGKEVTYVLPVDDPAKIFIKRGEKGGWASVAEMNRLAEARNRKTATDRLPRFQYTKESEDRIQDVARSAMIPPGYLDWNGAPIKQEFIDKLRKLCEEDGGKSGVTLKEV